MQTAADKRVRSTRVLLPGEQFQILRLPAHRGINAIPSAGVVKENPLLHLPGIHFAVFAEMDCSLGKAVGLPARVQSVHVGFVFLSADECVHDRVRTKPKTETSSTTSGRTAVSPTPG